MTLRTVRIRFSDFDVSIVDFVAADDMVWIRNRATGVNTGSVVGRPPTGGPLDITVITLLGGGPATHKTGGSKDASNGSGVVVTENRCEWDLVKSSGLGYDLWITAYAGADREYFDEKVTHETPIPGLGEAAAGHPFESGGFGEVDVISKGTVIGIYGSLPSRDGIQQAAALAVTNL